jgi:hypothetical protein
MLIRRRRGKTFAGVQMSKNPRKPPPPLYPLVMRVPGDDFHLTAEQFAALEKAGNVTLSEKHQTQLDTLADFWINDLRTRSSARPEQFRESFKEMKKGLCGSGKGLPMGSRREVPHGALGDGDTGERS